MNTYPDQAVSTNMRGVESGSRLVPWSPPGQARRPAFPSSRNFQSVLQRSRRETFPSHAPKDSWTIRVSGFFGDDLWLSGSFINWRIPGIHMILIGQGLWQSILTLSPGQHQFACYEIPKGHGFQRLTHAAIECGLSHPTSTSSPE